MQRGSHLHPHSTVLRDLISIPNSSGDNTITFTDPEIETAEIISHFLEFSHCRDKCFWPYFPEFPTVLIVRLAEFLNKYNGQVAIHVLTRAVWSALNDDEIEIQVVFLLAVMFDDDSLRNAVLRVINVGSLMDMGQGKSLKSRESRVKKAYEFFRRLPPKYGFALFRTFICSTEETGYGDVNHFIDTLLFIEVSCLLDNADVQ